MSDWRIDLIPWCDGEDVSPSPWFRAGPLGCGAMLLGPLCIVGSLLVDKPLLVLVGFALAFLGLGLSALGGWWQRRRWKRVPAKVLDHEFRPVRQSGGKGRSWAFRLRCEYETDDGDTLEVTPCAHWRSFFSKAGLERFLAARIDADDNCTLLVNPENPRQTLLGKG